jgi:multicomponent Na+:H+ antiporter subunit D
MLIGFALLKPLTLAGLAIYVVGHGFAKGGLFACAGILLHRFGSVDEFELRGRGRAAPFVGVLMALGALALTGAPSFGLFFGQSLIDDTADAMHLKWLTCIILPTEILTSAAVLRATARIFLGWGKTPEGTSRGAPHIPMQKETKGGRHHVPAPMWLAATVMIAASLAVCIPRSFRHAVENAAMRFEQSSEYTSAVLHNEPAPAPVVPFHESRLSCKQPVAVGGALLIALAALFPAAMGAAASGRVGHALHAAMRPLRKLQSGQVCDYTAWLTFGLAAYGGLLLFLWKR